MDEVRAFEAQHGIVLPEDYIKFITTVANGSWPVRSYYPKLYTMQETGSLGSGHKALLKEVNKSKGNLAFRMVKAVVVFCNAKAVVGSNKYLYNCVEGFQLSWEASASSC